MLTPNKPKDSFSLVPSYLSKVLITSNPQAAHPPFSKASASLAQPLKINRKSMENLWEIYGKSIANLSNIYRESIENLLNISLVCDRAIGCGCTDPLTKINCHTSIMDALTKFLWCSLEDVEEASSMCR